MKSVLSLILSISFITVLNGCQDSSIPQNVNAEEMAIEVSDGLQNNVIGTWETVEFEFTNPDGQVDKGDASARHEIKIYTPTHYSFIYKYGDRDLRSGVGTYTYDGEGKLTETNIMNYWGDPKGQEVMTTIEWLSPDRIIQRATSDDGHKIVQTLQRIK